MINILITGGCGFIGSNLIESLIKNPNNYIICMDNLITGSLNNINKFINYPNFLFINHDICNEINLSINHLDQIYHLASLASPSMIKY